MKKIVVVLMSMLAMHTGEASTTYINIRHEEYWYSQKSHD